MIAVPRLLTEMMHSYFEEATAEQSPGSAQRGLPFSIPNIKTSAAPIRPIAKSEWETGRAPRCLKKTFKFSDSHMMAAFVHELMSHEIETGHHGKLTCEFPYVSVEVRTHDLDDVTELDQEYARMCDQIYEDTKHYRNNGHEEHSW